jgi:hypothetical protein
MEDDPTQATATRQALLPDFSSVPREFQQVVRDIDCTASAVGVKYFTSLTGSSATEGVDYLGVTNTLVFAANQTNLAFQVTIKDDLLTETNETVTLRPSNLTGGAVLGSRSNAVLRILSNE